jgi:hypothetical protein
MLQLFRKLLSREPQLTLNHAYFGRLLFIRSANAASHYWEGELAVVGLPEKVGLTIPAPESGPSEAQVHFCRALLGDLDALFTRCKPVFEGKFEEWTQQAFPSHWREDFSLSGWACLWAAMTCGRGMSRTSSRQRITTSLLTSRMAQPRISRSMGKAANQAIEGMAHKLRWLAAHLGRDDMRLKVAV